MGIKLGILPHQTMCVERLCGVFEEVALSREEGAFANPVFDSKAPLIRENIQRIQEDPEGGVIAKAWRTALEEPFGLDVRMETGTGKTYCYTRLMYELNKRYGFFKFMILVPTTPIKEGTRSFIESEYARRHFADLYPDKSISLSVLEPQKATKGRKMFPQAISDFARGTIFETGRIRALLLSGSMLLSKKTMERDYDQTLFGTYSNPYDTLRAVRPIVIIDEPHKFKRENKAYQRLIERIHPLCVIRFGATFPNQPKSEEKDYNNLVFNLGPCEAFNDNLVKGVATQMIEEESLQETKVKLLDVVSHPASCTMRNESTKKTLTLGVGDSLASLSGDFAGMTVSAIGKTEDERIKKGVTLSNGQILAKGDQIYAGVYGHTYQELMLRQAIKNHIEQERENFFRQGKIKTLSLFFIDSVYSYRGEEGDGPLRITFERLLKAALLKEWARFKDSSRPIEQEYADFLHSSLKDVSATNGGYFAEDNSSADADIQKEVDQILRDKESLLSFKDEKGKWNTRRFIFSKWTLREGWDNPNVFQICKLRSSGSEISKLQEVGRGLRLPVSEKGDRISDEQFYLTYLVDYSEKDFADHLVREINRDSSITHFNVKAMLSKVAQSRKVQEEEIFIDLLTNQWIDMNGNILPEKKDELVAKYPEFQVGLSQNKVINRNKKEQGIVHVRKSKFREIRELWQKMNQKYYLSLDDISDDELYEATLSIFRGKVGEEVIARTLEYRTAVEDGKMVLKEGTADYAVMEESMPYGDFLKKAQKGTGVPVRLIHKALCQYNKENPLPPGFCNRNTLSHFIRDFQLWFEEAFVKRFSYKALAVNSLETALTDIHGEPKEKIIQGNVGIIKDDNVSVPENFLYDRVIFDSPKEKQSIERSRIDEVIVFGKIPRRSVQVPLYFGGTTSPDFMYVIKKGQDTEINLIVETKDVDKESTLRGVEKLKIEAAKKFFETLQGEGIRVSFEKQLKEDDIVTMIHKLLK